MGKNMGYEVTHYDHIWGSLIGKYMAVPTLYHSSELRLIQSPNPTYPAPSD